MANYLLLNCPFCGGEPYLENNHRAFVKAVSTRVALVRCRQCDAKSSKFDIKVHGRAGACHAAVNAWNRRFDDDSL